MHNTIELITEATSIQNNTMKSLANTKEMITNAQHIGNNITSSIAKQQEQINDTQIYLNDLEQHNNIAKCQSKKLLNAIRGNTCCKILTLLIFVLLVIVLSWKIKLADYLKHKYNLIL